VEIVKDCNVEIGLTPMLGVRVSVEVGFEIVCNLLLVPHCSDFERLGIGRTGLQGPTTWPGLVCL